MYKLTVGLETHCELSTATKIFCACSTAFGAEPNAHCCPVCTGQPGSLPVLNGRVIDYAVKAGLALNCSIHERSVMERKHYIYPDLAKGYQISQYETPLCHDGRVTLSDGTQIRINRIHIEEDAGKLVHNWYETQIDYNRAGVPLIEIVTEPDFHTPEAVVEYLELVQTTLRHIGVSRCRTKEGSIRCDVNISVAEEGSGTLGTRTEVKNLNSFSSVYAAIKYEYARQKGLLEHGAQVVQETLGFDESTGRTFSQRDKEDADDYRYFPEPDILPVCITPERVEMLRTELPELPRARKARFIDELGLAPETAEQLVRHRRIADYFERAGETAGDYPQAARFVEAQLFQIFGTDDEREDFPESLRGEELGKLLVLLSEGKINSTVAKHGFAKMLTEGVDAQSLLAGGAGPEGEELKKLCAQAIEANEKAAADFRKGKEKALQAIVGTVMRLSRGRADAGKALELIRELLSGEG